MPITQDRMLALIASADHFLASYRVLRTGIKDILTRADQAAEPPTGTETLNSLASLLLAPTSVLEPDHVETVTRERTHFHHAQRDNIRSAARQRRQRGNPTYGDSDLPTSRHHGPHKHHASYTPSSTPLHHKARAFSPSAARSAARDDDTYTFDHASEHHAIAHESGSLFDPSSPSPSSPQPTPLELMDQIYEDNKLIQEIDLELSELASNPVA